MAPPTRSLLLSHWEIVIAWRGKEGEIEMEEIKLDLFDKWLHHVIHSLEPPTTGDPPVPPVPALDNSQSSLIGGASDRDIVTRGREGEQPRTSNSARSVARMCVFAKKGAELTRPPLVAHTPLLLVLDLNREKVVTCQSA